MEQPPAADLLSSDKVIHFEEVLGQEDLSFQPNHRPSIELALEMSSGKIGEWIVPFASGSFDHHQDLADQNLFRCLFGRDSLIISSLLASSKPKLQSETVFALAEHQGLVNDAASEEEPGRIAHEVREKNDPKAIEIAKVAGWGFPYYGSVDATLLWLIALENLVKIDPDCLERKISGVTLASRAEKATAWILTRLESGGGFIRSQRVNPNGLLNQVWKDSGDSYLTKSGRVAVKEGTASVETVGETYDALLAAANLARKSKIPWAITPLDIESAASQLRASLIENWWLGDYFAMGLSEISSKQVQLDALASNQWRLLDSKILDAPEFSTYVEKLIESVTDPDILGPNGIRTLAKSNPRYRPGGYHTGNSWPVDSALIARGLVRHGAHSEAREVGKRTVNAIESIGGYPEFFRSDETERSGVSRFIIDVFDSEINRSNRICQPPQLLQGWSIAAYSWFYEQKLTGKD
jgi:glycogen debranching enzyme